MTTKHQDDEAGELGPHLAGNEHIGAEAQRIGLRAGETLEKCHERLRQTAEWLRGHRGARVTAS